MYAKIVRVAGGVSIPMLLVTYPNGSAIVPQLRARGWVPWGGSPLITDTGASLLISPDRLRLRIDEETPLDDRDGNPVSPAGWWELVDQLGGLALIGVVPKDTPFDPEGFAQEEERLRDSPETANALVRVSHDDGQG